MLKEEDLIKKVADLFIQLFGKLYMQEHDTCCDMWNVDGNYLEHFRAYKGDRATNKWLEFAYVRVHKETGEAEFLDYRLPDGTRMENPIKRVRCA